MQHPPANRTRKLAGPWVIVEVPMEDRDLLYPSRRRFYSKEPEAGTGNHGSSEHLDKAHQFQHRREADSEANRIMHFSRGTWAEVVPFSIAWALVHSGGAPWEARPKKEVQDGPTPA